MKNVVLSRQCILKPVDGCDWASEMVLNPAMISDPDSGRIHMLVRVSGPYSEKQIQGKPLPYPIFLAYGYSDDGGENFTFDFDEPALAPALEYEADKLWVRDGRGQMVPAYHNGCMEDPRLFFVEGECYLTLACRMFPPGPYWEQDVPTQCSPDWALEPDSPFYIGDNYTVTVLYKVDLKALERRNYREAFTFITPLTDPRYGQDRDVIILPHKMMIDGQRQYVMIHRPVTPDRYDAFTETLPSMVMSAAPDFYSFANHATRREMLYTPQYAWQRNRVGTSTPVIDMGNGEWLLSFHGKQDDEYGYAQSFMILQEQENDFPRITYLYPERWITNEADFERPAKFGIPCIFFTGVVKLGNELLISYGAADEYAAIMKLDYEKIIEMLRQYPYNGSCT